MGSRDFSAQAALCRAPIRGGSSNGSKGYSEGNGWWSEKTSKTSNGNGHGSWWSEDKADSKGNGGNGNWWNERDPRLVGEESAKASHPSPTSSSAFAEAAMGRLAWLQAEKEAGSNEALEGWLNNAGYLSMGKENEIQHSHRTNHSEFSDAKMAQDAFRHSEAEPVMERHPEIMAVHHTGEHHTGVHHTAVHHTGVHHSAVHTGVHPTMHLSQDRSSDTSGIERSSTGRRSNPSRRTSVLEERNYQALVAERAAAEAKLQKDLRAVAPERWSEPMYQDRRGM
eukprot:Skav207484  [mRNA]  locus=scaffold2519:52163:56672:- [translate_table: standard]